MKSHEDKNQGANELAPYLHPQKLERTIAASVFQNCFFSHLLNRVLGLFFFKSLNTGGKFICQEGWACPQKRTLIMLCGHLNNNTGNASNWVMSFSKHSTADV